MTDEVCSFCLTRPATAVTPGDLDNICDDCSDPTVTVCEPCEGIGLINAGEYRGRMTYDECPACEGNGSIPKHSERNTR